MRRIEQDSRRYWTLVWLSQNPDAVLEATAIRDLGRRWLVELSDLALQTPYAAKGRLSPGQALKLKVGQVDAARDVLVLQEA